MQVPPPPPGFPGSSSSSFNALPAGWTEHVAPTGQPYFFHAPSGTSTYIRPGPEASGSSVPPPPPAGFSEQATNGVTAPTKKKKKEKPVEKLPIDGTPWLRVTTNEGNVFFTNIETKASVWTVPEEIREQVEQQLLAKQNGNGHAANAEAEAEAARLLQEKEAEMQLLREELEREREASKKRKLEEEEQEASSLAQEDAQSAKRARASVQVEEDEDVPEQQEDTEEQIQLEEQEEELEDWQKDELQAKAELEAELQTPAVATDQTEYSSEEAIALFKTMLAEKDINPMKPWDMELPKFINDPRYKSVKQLRERRDLFDEHCKLKIRENRAKKNAAGQAKADPSSAYRALLVAEVTSTRTHWEDFRKKHKKDSRFRDFGRDDRERERVFRNWLRELGEIKRADAQKAEEKFMEMLKEHNSDISENARWSEVKGKFASDPRYNSVASSSQREEAFKKFLANRVPQSAEQKVDPEEAKRIAAEERKAKQAASLKEREEKVRREREALERQAGRSKAEAGREESEREYKTLLIDAVRDHEAKWSEVLPSLEQDRRYTHSNLNLQHKRRLFDEHLDEIYNKRINALESLFSSHSPKLQTEFDDVYSQISSNPIVTRLNMSEDRINRLYDEWSRRRYNQARKDFENLLNESSFVDYWMKLKADAGSKEFEKTKELLGNEEGGEDEDGAVNVEDGVDIRAMAAQIDMKELHSVLKHDKRYAIFDYEPEARETWLRQHVEKLAPPKQTVHQR